jgi:hypothetical protein
MGNVPSQWSDLRYSRDGGATWSEGIVMAKKVTPRAARRPDHFGRQFWTASNIFRLAIAANGGSCNFKKKGWVDSRQRMRRRLANLHKKRSYRQLTEIFT